MSVIIIQNEIVHYEVLGRGRPLILLHSWVGSWRYWIPTMQVTSTSFRTYALDLWGFGDSAKADTNYNLEGQLQLVDGFLQEMGIGKVALIGHGLGGIIALLFAQRYPMLVDRLMAISLPEQSEAINPRLSRDKPSLLAEWLLGARKEAAGQKEIEKADVQAIRQPLNEMVMVKFEEARKSLNTPCLYVHGGNDPLIPSPPEGEAEELLGPTAHLIVFENAGHFPMLEEASKFNRLVFDFLSLPSGISPRELQLKEEWKRRVR